jgi:hypothetical protein
MSKPADLSVIGLRQRHVLTPHLHVSSHSCGWASSDSAFTRGYSLSEHTTMGSAGTTAIDLYWLPLGAGGHSVRWNGRVFEWFAARLAHRGFLMCPLCARVLVSKGATDNPQLPARPGGAAKVSCDGEVTPVLAPSQVGGARVEAAGRRHRLVERRPRIRADVPDGTPVSAATRGEWLEWPCSEWLRRSSRAAERSHDVRHSLCFFASVIRRAWGRCLSA